jgi:hypothetical protein
MIVLLRTVITVCTCNNKLYTIIHKLNSSHSYMQTGHSQTLQRGGKAKQETYYLLIPNELCCESSNNNANNKTIMVSM